MAIVSKGKKESEPSWRPNFVNKAELPDIKIVRTDFIVNIIAVTVAICVVFFLLQREYRSYALSQTVAKMEERIRSAGPDDAKFLKFSETFRKSAQYVIELEKFYDVPFNSHDFLYELSQIKPEDLIFKSVSLSESNDVKAKKVDYVVSISGDAKNLTVIEQFKNILGEAEIFQVEGYDLSVNETLSGRDEKTGIFPYKISVRMSPIKKAAAKKKGGAK
jgi:hypothetical protein